MILRRAGIALLVLAGIAALAALAGQHVLQRWLDTPLAIGEEAIGIEIPRGQALGVTSRQLAERGVLDHPRWLEAYARATGVDARVKAGEYSIPPGSTPRSLLALFESGRSSRDGRSASCARRSRPSRICATRSPAMTRRR